MESLLLILLCLLIALPLAIHLITLALTALRYLGTEPAAQVSAPLPSVTLIRPVRGLDATERDTLRSSFELDHPDLQLIFCAASDEDAALPFIRQLMADYPQADAQILTGDRKFSGNPKLNNVEKGWLASRGEIVVMTDSNLLLPRDYIARLLERFGPGIGMVSGPPVGTGPQNFWARVECAFLNTSQGRWQLAADALGAGFAQGKTLAYRRDVLERGGIEALAQNLAEDVASTRMVRGQGLRVRLTRRLFAQPVPLRDAKGVWARQLRWSQIRREGFPAIWALEILQGPFLPVLALILLGLAGQAPWQAVWGCLLALLVLWYGAEWALARLAGWPSSLSDLCAMSLRDLLLPVLWCATWGGGGLTWQGQAVTPSAQKVKPGN